MRNEEPNKRFIGLQWSTINCLLDYIFDEFVLLKKIQFERLLGKIGKKIEQISFSLKVVTKTSAWNLVQ